MGIEDHQRAEREGYSGVHSAPASNIDEAMGRAAGEARRHAEQQGAHQATSGYDSLRLPLRFVPLVLGAAIALLLGVRPALLLLLGAALAGLASTSLVRRLLGTATPVYAGTLIGLCMSAVSLMGGDAPLIAENILIYPALGALFGGAYALIRWFVRR
ncbi:MAG: hypothetical protein KF909_12885 [Rhodocyclaceae bacterium]|nr:hypothetical protein [Rhodocyclaceae bacterium]MCB1911785.1 hypothetical protein [Rhodocyclaceae bacterium]MCP5241712.1 hypothetical protein [Zoogloeaceae bacterium]MCP5256264.1 hypothetical protein [Zoogloeaceae bacterium]MCW5616783.1 hypothetical protein [Rhodocyclaceae bacterium]